MALHVRQDVERGGGRHVAEVAQRVARGDRRAGRQAQLSHDLVDHLGMAGTWLSRVRVLGGGGGG